MNQNALTIKNTGLANVLSSEVNITPPYIGQPVPNLPNVVVKGIWDTGATNSVINSNVAKSLGLQPIGLAKVHTASHTVNANVYLVNVILPSNVAIQGLRVTEGQITNFDMLIGMDIINHGDFSVTNHKGKTVMTFRTPSCHEVDYVRDINVKAEKDRIQQGLQKYSPSKKKKKHSRLKR